MRWPGLLFAIAAVLASLSAVDAYAAKSGKRRGVSLDVKDAEVRDVLRSMQQQCGIRNLLIDRDVAGSGTIYFREVPCETAFKVVFQQFGLAGQILPNSVVTVETRDR